MNVINTATIPLEVILATALHLAIDFKVMATLVKVSRFNQPLTLFKYVNLDTDINECAELTDGCAQICVDTDGSYHCSCDSGYSLSSDNFGCNGV